MKRWLVGLLVVVILTMPIGVGAEDAPHEWWRDTVWYEIFVRSFYDSTGDGIGDFRGLIEKLDYLEYLGITGVWLMPIVDAASYHGYDAIDYYNVHPDFGTNEDFLAFMEAARERGIRVIVDMVLNHTSDQHEWFQRSLAGDPDYADWYIWRDTNPNTPGPWGAQAWHPRGGRYFYGVFWGGMPDLNFENEAVNAQMYDVTRFWIEEMGVDGFRLDAIKYIIEDGDLLQNSPRNRQWLADYNAYVKSLNPEAITVGEVLDTTQVVLRYTLDESMDIGFEFDLASDIIASVLARNNRNITRRLTRGLRDYPPGQYATFLTNHDQTRLMTLLGGNIAQNKIAATILLTIEGTPFIYYGEEIGMLGSKPDPRLRTPMHWTDDPVTAGFTTAARPYERLTDGVEIANVASQIDDPDSLLNHYRAMIQLRHDYSALRRGTLDVVTTEPFRVFSYVRQDDASTLLILINMQDVVIDEYALALDAGNLAGVTGATLLWGEGEVSAPNVDEDGNFEGYVPLASLEPFGIYILELTYD